MQLLISLFLSVANAAPIVSKMVKSKDGDIYGAVNDFWLPYIFYGILVLIAWNLGIFVWNLTHKRQDKTDDKLDQAIGLLKSLDERVKTLERKGVDSPEIRDIIRREFDYAEAVKKRARE